MFRLDRKPRCWIIVEKVGLVPDLPFKTLNIKFFKSTRRVMTLQTGHHPVSRFIIDVKYSKRNVQSLIGPKSSAGALQLMHNHGPSEKKSFHLFLLVSFNTLK
jgi:hypothetical protein